MKDIKSIIEENLKNSFQNLKDYHQNTFDYEDYEPHEKVGSLTGEEIYEYISDTEMESTEDAYYLMGKVEAYKEMLYELKKEI